RGAGRAKSQPRSRRSPPLRAAAYGKRAHALTTMPGISHEEYEEFKSPIDHTTAPSPNTNPVASNAFGARRATSSTRNAATGSRKRPMLNPVTKLKVMSAPAAAHAKNHRQARGPCGLRETMIAA